MGNKVVTFTEDQFEDYQDCTFFTRKEILRVHKRFRDVSPDLVPKCMTGNEPVTVRVPREKVEKLPELRENPFRQRICEVFSRDGKGNLTFEDFLDMLSVFSEQASRDIKVFYAFKIYALQSVESIYVFYADGKRKGISGRPAFARSPTQAHAQSQARHQAGNPHRRPRSADFDGDQHLGPGDLERTLRLLTRSELAPEEVTQVCEKVVEESDVDGDGKLSFMEFEHVITRAPDFLSTFHIRI